MVSLVSIQDQVELKRQIISQMTVGGVRPWAAGVRNPSLPGPEKGRSWGEAVVVIQGSRCRKASKLAEGARNAQLLNLTIHLSWRVSPTVAACSEGSISLDASTPQRGY